MSKASKKRYNIPRLKLYNNVHDSGTQTSKTILELAKMEMTDAISPDSLMSSPRDCDSLTNFEEDGSVDDVPVKRHVYNRRQYLYNERTPANERNKSLIEMFLAKSNNKPPNNETKARFLQQTSPLRYISKESSVTLKSQSYVETKSRNSVDTRLTRNRFRIKNVKEYTEDDEKKPVKYFCPDNSEPSKFPFEIDLYSPKTKECGSSKRGSSFMCPTISSENKNKLPEIQCLNKLISPTRRGRSYSPDERRGDSKHRIIPYIDQSEESCACKDTGFVDNTTVVKKAEIQILRKSPFEEDLLKIDQLSLNVSSEVRRNKFQLRFINSW